MANKIITWTTHSFDKILADAPAPKELKKEYTVYMTKGESEACQIVARAGVTGKSVTLTKIAGEGLELSLFSMERVHVINGIEYTDSAIPYGGQKIDLRIDRNVPFILDFKTERDTKAGDYAYSFAVTDESGEAETFNITVHVWDFALPEERTFATSVGIGRGYIGFHDKRNTDPDPGYCDEEHFIKYYDILLEHNLCGHVVPYGVMDDRADKYLSDPRVTSFTAALWGADDRTDEEVLAIYNKIKSNPVWHKKAFFYLFDEPHKPEHFVDYKRIHERYTKLCPDIPCTSPYYTNLQMGEGLDQVQFMSDYTKLHCPKLCLWNDEITNKDLDFTPPPFADRMHAFQKRGDTMWCYVCNDPILPYGVLFTDAPGAYQKAMFWQMFQRDIHGFLYWGTASWGYHGEFINPWLSPYTGVGDGEGKPVYGEGYLLYPGATIRRKGPIPTIRLKIVRDAIDDIELFEYASKFLGREWVLEKVNSVTPSLTEVTDDYDYIANVRVEIGNALEKALKA